MVSRRSIPAQAFVAYVPIALLGHIVELSNDFFALKVLDQVWVGTGIILAVEFSRFAFVVNISACYEVSLIVEALFVLLKICR